MHARPSAHWGRMTRICVSNLIILGSDNGVSHDQRKAIIWTNAGILLIGPLGTNFSEILIEIHRFSFTKIRLKMLAAKWRLFCLGLNVLTWHAVHNTRFNLIRDGVHDALPYYGPVMSYCDGNLLWKLASVIAWCQAISWANVDILWIGYLWTNFNEISAKCCK